jgi:hypothetical protein
LSFLASDLASEATGLDPLRDEIVEMALLPFTYGLDGTVYADEGRKADISVPSTLAPDFSREPRSAMLSLMGEINGIEAGRR